jgi:organic hydroperoxide reductase OsmC/OhrA
VPPRAKVLEYQARVDRLGAISAHGGDPVALPADVEPEHLLLAALVRCTIASLRFHARRLGADAAGSGTAHGLVTRRESDGRYAFVEIRAELEVEIDPPPEHLLGLLERAMRDCFISASLTVKPHYRWTVNGAPVDAR